MKKIIALVLFIVSGCSSNKQASNLIIQQQPISSILIEDYAGPTVIELTDQDQIDSLIKSLKLDEWKLLDKWEIDMAPNFFLLINDEMLIGLFD